MATLVLTAVGFAIGGPVGGAVGALIGQGVDARLLAPKRREGPRLTELAIQTSSYGTQLPRLFGTMRVAGTVIWATDLHEKRERRSAGKGQPKVNTYSYSASFAVALSARPILGVRRVWANGKLVRGSAGDWKVHTGFRVHPGSEDQAVDPLIASAEGATPAHRGIAYAVFEGLELADFGNRIPSLTFEVVADAGAVLASDVAKAIAPEVEGRCALALDGFAGSGGSVRAVLETLGTMSGAWFGADGAVLTMRDAAGAGAVAVVEDAGFSADGRAARRGRRIAAADLTPRTVTVAHYDAARDYQTGVQREARPGTGGREERVEVPAVVSAGVAKGIAQGVLARGEARRVRRSVATGFAGMALVPGDAVRIAGEAGVWRIVQATLEAMVVRLELVPVTPASLPVSADAGRVLPQIDAAIGRTVPHVFETPALDDVPPTGPRLTIAAAGEGAGWRRAGLLYSLDAEGSWGANWVEAGATALPAVIGRVVEAPPRAPSAVIDAGGAFVVDLSREDTALEDADDARLDAGANLAMIGDELVQFGRAERLTPTHWRLSRLLRGRRGTEGAAPQAAGDRFVLVEADTIRVLDLSPGAIGATVRVLASGVGDVEGPAAASLRLAGTSLLPPSPVHLRTRLAADGSATVTWVRRSRVGWRWIDGVDAALGEEAEGYRATVTRADGSVREAAVDAPALTIDPGELVAGPVAVAIRMRGTHGESAPTSIIISSTGVPS